MLIEESGFPPMIRLLEAFDRGLDVDEAFADVFATTPEAVDARFEAFVDELLADLRIEPRWSPASVVQRTLATRGDPPEEPAARERWVADVCSLAWGHWQADARVDAEQALRKLATAGASSPRAHFLRGEMSILADRIEEGREHWEAGLAAGGEDYRVRLGLGKLAADRGDHGEARRHFEAAERAFPGYDDPTASAELMLAMTLRELDLADEAHAAVERWLAYNPGALEPRLEIAEWHEEQGRFAEAERRYREANEIDPFRRSLHLRWSRVLEELGRLEEAARELEVALLVPAALDAEGAPELQGSDRAAVLAHQARLYLELDDGERAAAKARAALELDPDCAEALEVQGALQ